MCTDCNDISLPIGPTGPQGTPGVNGTNGTDGTCTAVVITDVTACGNGGKHFQVGVDTDCDGVIDIVLYDFDLCNGLDGTNGTDSTAPFDGSGGGIIEYDGDIADASLWLQAPDPNEGLGINSMVGWAYCNGLNNTPDLRGQYTVCTGQNQTPTAGDLNPLYVLFDEQGLNTVPLVKANIPRHQHVLNGDGATSNISGGAHDHTYDKYVSDGGPIDGDNGPNDFSYVGTNTSSNTHNHNTGEFSGSTGNGASDGLPATVTRVENRPVSIALHKIKRIS